MNPNLNGNALEAEPIEEVSISGGTGDPQTEAAAQPSANPWVTRADALKTAATSKKPLILLGGGVGVAVLLFVLTTFAGKSPRRQPTPQQNNVAHSSTTERPKGSVTPVMDTVRTAASSNTSGQLTAADINRTKATTGLQTASVPVSPPPRTSGPDGATLGSIPPFDSTQQRWEEPKPYGEGHSASQSPAAAPSQNLLKEASLVFVRKTEVANANPAKPHSDNGNPALQLSLTPGTRIQARLETQVSSATALSSQGEVLHLRGDHPTNLSAAHGQEDACRTHDGRQVLWRGPALDGC